MRSRKNMETIDLIMKKVLNNLSTARKQWTTLLVYEN